MNVIDKFLKEVANSSGAIGSAGGVASYESPARMSVAQYISRRFGCDKKSDHHARARCMIRGRIAYLQRKLENCKDSECRKVVTSQLETWRKKLRDEIARPRYRKVSTNKIQEQSDDVSPDERFESKKQLEKIKVEMNKIMATNRSYKQSNCRPAESARTRSTCKIKSDLAAIKRLTALSKKCEETKHHKRSCLRKVKTMVNNLKSNIEKEMEVLKKT